VPLGLLYNDVIDDVCHSVIMLKTTMMVSLHNDYVQCRLRHINGLTVTSVPVNTLTAGRVFIAAPATAQE